MPVVLRAQGGEEHRAAVERDLADGGPEALHHDVRVPPLPRRRGLRIRGREVPAAECEQPPDEELRWPRAERDPAAGLEDAEHLPNRNLRARSKDVRELAQDYVELVVREGQGLRVPLPPHDVLDAGDRRIPPPGPQEPREAGPP